ncbi:hypothetical protein [Lysinibacillus sp. BPa_S21]|uniref:hypothetical protein n=1 Tax=Lysinibacillus sp. BPa_S21 TaxID=2932478 RepID=UPI0020120D04|nr:hypothetical protein [Lysinibacillus sp. BPa_S21]MCL1695153.1 hypothetical protein [Lysinibacillus sp. BPa_S21]
MTFKEQEEIFLTVFEELIESFSTYKINNNKHRLSIGELELTLNGEISDPEISATASSSGTNNTNTKLELKFSSFMASVESTDFYREIIPYDKITECVFAKTPTEMLNPLTSELRTRGEKYFEEHNKRDSSEEITFLKIMRHIDLALIQKNSFANIKLKDMDELAKEYKLLSDKYTKLKKEADKQYKNMLTQYISILGIFAAILMGAFGAIQSFTSLFANANGLSIGKLLIISSIGASSVILILFFLLNGIAKLTDRSLSSTDKKDGTWYEKHPSLVVIHAVLVLIVLIGASLELSNVHLQLAWQGFWWLLPLIWLTYIIAAIYKRHPFFLFISIKQWRVNSRKKKEVKASKSEQKNNQ